MPASEPRRRQKRVWVPSLAAIVVLVHGLVPRIPEGYHAVIRWVCFLVLAYLAFKIAWEVSETLSGLYAVSAIAHNPFYPFQLTGRERTGLYLATIALAVVAIVVVRPEASAGAPGGGVDLRHAAPQAKRRRARPPRKPQ